VAAVAAVAGVRGLTARLARMIAADATPAAEAWLDLGERAFVDTVGVLFAGRKEPAVAALVEAVLAEEADGPSRSLAAGRGLPARSAALVDATSAHALDYDDVDDALLAHPSTVLVPALLALGDAGGSSGGELLVAYRRGLETGRAVAGALGIEAHYQAGWHATGTIGTLAAAGAAARLLRLPPQPTQHCLGMAASMAGGSRQNFGTMTKPLHAGLAAERGILAAQLAARGFTADPDQLEGPIGFLALYRGAGGAAPPFPARIVPVERHDPCEEPSAPPGLNVKLHPCCYATHTAIDAALELRPSLPALEEVTGIEVVVRPGGLAPLIHHRPTDGLQAKFSLEYAVAAALLDGDVTLATFDDARARREDVQQLLRRVAVGTAETPPAGPPGWDGAFPAVVTVRLAGGGPAVARVDAPAGHATRPVTEEQLRAKFADCLASAGHEAVDDAYDVLRHLRRQPSVTTVLDVLVGRRGRDAVSPS
jgi:2-methylcitrate dehydratase PrpD